MRIVDYEKSRELSDVGLILTSEEADELCAYLHRLREDGPVKHVHLSQFSGILLCRELTVALDERHAYTA